MVRMAGLVKSKSLSDGPTFRTPGRPSLNDLCPENLNTFAPELSLFMHTVLDLFELQNPSVHRHFKGHPMASTTFNFGPQTCTFPHEDLKNLSWGWCSVTSLGSYDPEKGGHLVLWDLKMAVEFPPYSTILIPSAILMHSNASIGEAEKRLTVTQYSSCGLYAWSAYGNRPKKEAENVRSWWRRPKHMFSTMNEIVRRASGGL